MKHIILLFIFFIPFYSFGSTKCKDRIAKLQLEASREINNQFEEFTLNAISLANQIEKKEIWENHGQYFYLSSGRFKAIFKQRKRSLTYFSNGNAFIEAFISNSNGKIKIWCSND